MKSVSKTSVFSAGFDEEQEEGDSLSNLADLMLVLCVGLLVALVTHWGVNISQIQQNDMTPVEDGTKILNEMQGEQSSFSETGTVYSDPETGKTYVIEKQK